MLPARAFYLLRHGQTVANAADITAGGQYDSPLNEIGIAQAAALANVIHALEIKPQVIWHSHMVRARDTALAVNRVLKLETNEHRELREHDMGDWDGLHWDNVLPLIEKGQSPPNGESRAQFGQRVKSIFDHILVKEQSRLPLIVAHGGLFYALASLYKHKIQDITNCHLHYFEPWSEQEKFPWRVWHFDVEDNGLKKSPAAFCLSRTLKQMDGA